MREEWVEPILNARYRDAAGNIIEIVQVNPCKFKWLRDGPKGLLDYYPHFPNYIDASWKRLENDLINQILDAYEGG